MRNNLGVCPYKTVKVYSPFFVEASRTRKAPSGQSQSFSTTSSLNNKNNIENRWLESLSTEQGRNQTLFYSLPSKTFPVPFSVLKLPFSLVHFVAHGLLTRHYIFNWGSVNFWDQISLTSGPLFLSQSAVKFDQKGHNSSVNFEIVQNRSKQIHQNSLTWFYLIYQSMNNGFETCKY